MTTYIVIEMEDIELTSLAVFLDRKKAHAAFEKLVDASVEPEYGSDDLANELKGTLRMAGDDAYSIQLITREIP